MPSAFSNVGGIGRHRFIDIHHVRTPFHDYLLQLQRQIDYAVAPLEITPPGAAVLAVAVVRGIGGHLETQVTPAIEVERTGAVNVVAVPRPCRADTDPAFAFGVAKAVDHPSPVAVGLDP